MALERMVSKDMVAWVVEKDRGLVVVVRSLGKEDVRAIGSRRLVTSI
jgi:hypothetical protein